MPPLALGIALNLNVSLAGIIESHPLWQKYIIYEGLEEKKISLM